MSKKKIGIIMGPNGSGKGTLAEKLINEFNYVHLSSRDLIHNWIRRNNASEYKELIDQGHLINDNLVRDILLEHFAVINDEEIPSNVILDGFPRRDTQVEVLKEICERFGYSVEWIIVLNITLEQSLDRIAGRVVGPNRQIYHTTYNPPPKHFKEEELKRREDDKPEIAKRRYEEYYSNTLTILSNSFFLNTKVYNLDASKSIDEVAGEAIGKIGQLEEQNTFV